MHFVAHIKLGDVIPTAAGTLLRTNVARLKCVTCIRHGHVFPAIGGAFLETEQTAFLRLVDMY